MSTLLWHRLNSVMRGERPQRGKARYLILRIGPARVTVVVTW